MFLKSVLKDRNRTGSKIFRIIIIVGKNGESKSMEKKLSKRFKKKSIREGSIKEEKWKKWEEEVEEGGQRLENCCKEGRQKTVIGGLFSVYMR